MSDIDPGEFKNWTNHLTEIATIVKSEREVQAIFDAAMATAEPEATRKARKMCPTKKRWVSIVREV